MNKTFLIFSHEFLHTIKKPGFLIITLAVPVLVLILIIAGQLISGGEEPASIEAVTIGYVDETGDYSLYTDLGYLKMVLYDSEDAAIAALTSNKISEYFVIPADFIATGQINRYTLKKEIDAPPYISAGIKYFITSNILEGKVSQETVLRIDSPLNMTTTRLTETGKVAKDQGGYGNIIIPGIFAFLLAFSLQLSATYLIQGLGDEKETRLIEVLLSSVSIRQLVTGKVLGLGAAGLTQVAVWLISAPLLLNMASSSFGGIFSTIQIPENFVVLGLIYFVLGYMLFASLSAGIGAISPSAREGEQLAMIYTMLNYVPLWFSGMLIAMPDSPLWDVLMIFPVTAPVTTMFRLGVGEVQVWELAASLTVLALTVVGVLLLSVKVFRIYLLMYGKRPGLREIIRNLRYG